MCGCYGNEAGSKAPPPLLLLLLRWHRAGATLRGGALKSAWAVATGSRRRQSSRRSLCTRDIVPRVGRATPGQRSRAATSVLPGCSHQIRHPLIFDGTALFLLLLLLSGATATTVRAWGGKTRRGHTTRYTVKKRSPTHLDTAAMEDVAARQLDDGPGGRGPEFPQAHGARGVHSRRLCGCSPHVP